MLAAMNREVTGTVNIGTQANYSINQLATLIGGDAEFIPERIGEARETLADNSKARELLGWVPKVELAEGIAVVDAYEKRNPPGLIISI